MTSSTTLQTAQLRDTLERPLHDLRLSVIDRCNFRCNYCMPETDTGQRYNFLNHHHWLSYEEMERCVQALVTQGVSKVRLTGGEPLLRPGLTDFIAHLATIEGIDDLALTTNGSLLAQHAKDLKKAGLHRLTVSLDTLDEKTFHQMNGQRGSVQTVLNGIDTATAAGFESIKINVVVQRGVNEHHLLNLIEYFKNSRHILRFIEYMDVGNCNHWKSEYVVPSKEILALIHAQHPLQAVASSYYGEVAARYQFCDGTGEIGFISSVTQPFCGACTRMRLSTDGKLYTCLFASAGTDLRPILKQKDSKALTERIRTVWKLRQDRYSQERPQHLASTSHPPKVEMFQVGG